MSSSSEISSSALCFLRYVWRLPLAMKGMYGAWPARQIPRISITWGMHKCLHFQKCYLERDFIKTCSTYLVLCQVFTQQHVSNMEAVNSNDRQTSANCRHVSYIMDYCILTLDSFHSHNFTFCFCEIGQAVYTIPNSCNVVKYCN